MTQMQRFAFYFFKIFICCFNHSCWHTNSHRIIRYIMGHNSPSTNHNIASDCDTWQNYHIISYIDVIPNCDRLCNLQIRDILSIDQCTTIMSNKFHPICYMHIISKSD